ncbi:MAG TPA: hypothetical protein ENJ01_11900 [Gammaproteobacteria bacterium]|nr:hypothetical protein [Gammaproteobacteria bacterium]
MNTEEHHATEENTELAPIRLPRHWTIPLLLWSILILIGPDIAESSTIKLYAALAVGLAGAHLWNWGRKRPGGAFSEFARTPTSEAPYDWIGWIVSGVLSLALLYSIITTLSDGTSPEITREQIIGIWEYDATISTDDTGNFIGKEEREAMVASGKLVIVTSGWIAYRPKGNFLETTTITIYNDGSSSAPLVFDVNLRGNWELEDREGDPTLVYTSARISAKPADAYTRRAVTQRPELIADLEQAGNQPETLRIRYASDDTLNMQVEMIPGTIEFRRFNGSD